jgi:nucleotide-binding universal stress UspA family protein
LAKNSTLCVRKRALTILRKFCAMRETQRHASLLKMRILVGIDTAPGHDGPLHFCKWLVERAEFPNALVAGHVVPSWPVFGNSGDEPSAALESSARATVEHEVARCDAKSTVAQVVTTSDNDLAAGLLRLAEEVDAGTIVLGRRAKQDEARLVRLGRTVRRTLRQSDRPCIVVPPDYEAPITAGPIVLTTDLEPHSLAAASYAVLLATRFRLPLHIIHVAAAESWTATYIPADAINLFSEQARSAGEARLNAWANEHHLPGTALRQVMIGDPTAKVATYAESVQASLIVTGSRPASEKNAIFGYSASMEIAASATTPVAIVPATST